MFETISKMIMKLAAENKMLDSKIKANASRLTVLADKSNYIVDGTAKVDIQKTETKLKELIEHHENHNDVGSLRIIRVLYELEETIVDSIMPL